MPNANVQRFFNVPQVKVPHKQFDFFGYVQTHVIGSIGVLQSMCGCTCSKKVSNLLLIRPTTAVRQTTPNK